MKNVKIIKVLVMFFFTSFLYSQNMKMCAYRNYLTETEIQNACGPVSYVNNREAENVVDKILSNVGLFRNFIIKECPHISNAVAVTVRSSLGGFERYIIYDKSFLDQVSGRTGTDWGAISIMAHEIGHHLNGHTLIDGIDNHQSELQADEFSGFVLAKMGATLEESLQAISFYGSDSSSESHPEKSLRIISIKNGWEKGNYADSKFNLKTRIELYGFDKVKIDYFVKKAIENADFENYSTASSYILNAFQYSAGLEKDYLYYAANYAVNAKEYDKALEYYKILKDINYSGEKINFIATNKKSGKDEYFADRTQLEYAIKNRTHKNSRYIKEPSKRGEIYRNIALILVEEGKIEEAKSAIVEARKANPDDTSLIMSEADIYLKTNDMATYAKLISEVLAKDPNNADLVYNLGVVSGQNKDIVNAKKYYLRAIEINPNYANAYFNLSAVRIDEAQLLLDEMNKLGTTAADNKKYDVLKTKREEILKDVVTLLEKTTSLDPKNKPAKEVLLSVYKALEMKEKTKVLQAELHK